MMIIIMMMMMAMMIMMIMVIMITKIILMMMRYKLQLKSRALLCSSDAVDEVSTRTITVASMYI